MRSSEWISETSFAHEIFILSLQQITIYGNDVTANFWTTTPLLPAVTSKYLHITLLSAVAKDSLLWLSNYISAHFDLQLLFSLLAHPCRKYASEK